MLNNNEQNKFERLASLFHREKSDGQNTQCSQEESRISEDADLWVVKKIFDFKDLVYLAGKISPAGEAWNKVHSRIKRKHRQRNIGYWQYAAAVITIILTVGLFAGRNIRQYFSDPERYISIVSPLGEIKNLTLSDGTEVWLNSSSTLKYSNLFGKTNRLVIIEGEALFKVFKDSKNPFTVSLGNSKVIVHGTTFNVKDYSSDDKCEVVLIEGIVEYVNSLKSIFLKPGERISEIKASKYLVKDHVNTEIYTSWICGKVYFDNQSLLDLVTLLEKWYNVNFEFANTDARFFKFTGVINREQTLEYTLKIIETTNKVKFVKKGGKMLITN